MVLRFGLQTLFFCLWVFSTIEIIKKECKLFEEKLENKCSGNVCTCTAPLLCASFCRKIVSQIHFHWFPMVYPGNVVYAVLH